MTREELKKLLPHRENMLLLDEAEVIDGRAHGKKYIRDNEFFLNGHFPGDPIVPGVILCEIMAQSTCVLLADKFDGPIKTLFTGLDQVRFKHPVRPGEWFDTVCEIEKSKGPFYWAKGKGYVRGELCVTASFSFAIMPNETEPGAASGCDAEPVRNEKENSHV